MTAIVVMTDGRRECIARSIPSLERLHGTFTGWLIHDDSADPEYRAWLGATFPHWDIHSTPYRSGFAGAMRSAREQVQRYGASHVWWHEDDFILTRDVDVSAMAGTLDAERALVQLALRRQPWNDAERAAGGIVEQHPDQFYEVWDRGRAWLEHRRFFTTNPHLIRAEWLTETQWPEGPESEGRYGLSLFAGGRLRCGFWGSRDSGEWCEHIGHERLGTGY
jgi:hypothetical protein